MNTGILLPGCNQEHHCHGAISGAQEGFKGYCHAKFQRCSRSSSGDTKSQGSPNFYFGRLCKNLICILLFLGKKKFQHLFIELPLQQKQEFVLWNGQHTLLS